MVEYAYTNTKFYRDLFRRCDVTPQDIKTFEDLEKLEHTTKSDLQDHSEDLLAATYTKEMCHSTPTSGSTGTPAIMLYDNECYAYYVAESMVEMFDAGYKPWEKIAYTKRRPWHFYSLQNLGLMRAYHILSTLPEEEQALKLKEVSPSLILSYPLLLYSIARIVKSGGYIIHPRSVIIGGEMLIPHVRKYIEDVFKTRIYETYATVEFSTIARECKYGNWHINTSKCVVEFVEGKILVTSLLNKALPLIRYEIGDAGRPKEGVCPCGRGAPMMEILEGRLGDIYILPNGREVPPLRVWKTHLILDSNVAAKRYQIIQEEPDFFIIRLVPTRNFTEKIADELKTQLVEDLQYPVKVEIEIVDAIPLIDDRKLRANISRVRR